MKKFLVLLFLLMLGSSAHASYYEVFNYTNTSMKNFWEQNGKYEEKVLSVGTRIINANKLEKRVPIQIKNSPGIINASSYLENKTVVIYSGILPYLDNDDELAYVLGHEIAHSIDSYGGYLKWFAMIINTREYEYKADLKGLDLMVKAGYNPIAAITCANKWMPESPMDTFLSHPVTSKRLIAMYKYIYIKYPWALESDMVKNINYVNFTYSAQKEISAFQQRQKDRDSKKVEDL